MSPEKKYASDAILGITVPLGRFLPFDCSCLILGETWQSVAPGW